MNNVRGSRPPTDEVRGGTAMPRTCTQPIPSLGSPVWGWFRCWIHSGVSRWFHEPPDAEPHVRWCGRTAGVIPPPTRLLREGPERTRLKQLLQGPKPVGQAALLHDEFGVDVGERDVPVVGGIVFPL